MWQTVNQRKLLLGNNRLIFDCYSTKQGICEKLSILPKISDETAG